MAGWRVSEQAISALNGLAAATQELSESIHQDTEIVKSEYEQHQSGLGSHSADIQALIEAAGEMEQEAAAAAKKLALKLRRAAMIRQKHIETNRYSGQSAAGGNAGNSATGSSSSGASGSGVDVNAEGKIAVSLAWEREKQLVLKGKGTRNWTVAQQQELLTRNPPKISGFEGQHMLDKSTYPQYAGDPNNIQFLTYEEHYFGAHNEKWKNSTCGRFDPETGEMIPISPDALKAPPVIELTDKIDPEQAQYLSGRELGYDRYKDNRDSRKRHAGEKSIPKRKQ